jgi:hypothetical protein
MRAPLFFPQLLLVIALRLSVSCWSIPDSEADSLVALWYATDGPSWTIEPNWNPNTEPCSWRGVGCGSYNVEMLNLFSFGLTGSLTDLQLPRIYGL